MALTGRRRFRVAAVQMDGRVAPTDDRLARAERLVEEAASDGARLVVLPEVFSTGYTYDDTNCARAETVNGRTASWMRSVAKRCGLYLAGSFYLYELGDVYNSLVLYAPDGRRWRYDKSYPWGWERSAFRGGRNDVVIADTELGMIGMLICWDTAHLDLWRKYAGRIELMLVSSCPADVTSPTYHLPDGTTLTFDDLPLLGGLKGSEDALFGRMLDEQTRWLGVPAVNTVATGRLRTPLPRSGVLAAPLSLRSLRLARRPWELGDIEMSCDFAAGCKVLGADGRVLSSLGPEDGETFTAAEVRLRDDLPVPGGPQPATRLSRAAYFLSDRVLPRLMDPVYRRSIERAWGARGQGARDSGSAAAVV